MSRMRAQAIGSSREVRADRIPKITTHRIYTDLAADELDQLPEYR